MTFGTYGKLTLGSGLSVGPTGVASDHHFNPREGSAVNFLYVDGVYEVEVLASVVGLKKLQLLQRMTFTVDSIQAAELIQIPTREMYLFWNADTRQYDGHVRHENRLGSSSSRDGIEKA